MVEIIRNTYDQAANDCTVLGAQHFLLQDPWWLSWLKRQIGNQRLFVYQHQQTKGFVISAWVYSPEEAVKPIMQELEMFKGRPDVLWPEDLMVPELLLIRFEPAMTLQEKRKRARRDAKAVRQAMLEEDAIEKEELMSHLKRTGLASTAAMIDSGELPWMGSNEGGERLKQLSNRLVSASKETIYA
jgi:hypothetical protein